MQRSKYLRMPLYAGISSMFLFGPFLFADIKETSTPLSGLNLEDFKSTPDARSQEWGSNPFVKYGDNPQAKQMILYGIVHGPHKAMALINSEVVRVGDKIGSSEVVSIERGKVILRNDDGLFQITMRGAPNEKTPS